MAILKKQLKLQLPAGKAAPTQTVGPALGQAGINIGEFITKFNSATAKMMGDIVPVVINVYDDRSFTFTLKSPPAANLLLKAIGVEKGSGATGSKKVGKVSKAQVREIAEKKLADLNTTNIESAMAMIAGTARSMGIEVV